MGATTVTGTILGVDNDPQVGVYVTFRLKSVGTDSVATSTIDRDAISAITDASGDFSTTLWDNGDSGIESILEIIMPSGQRIDVIIPAGDAAIDIWDLIENYQVGMADPQLPTNQSLFMRKANNLSDVASASTSRTNLSVSSTAETALVANNLSDLASASTGRTNLGVAIGSDVQAHSTNLDSVDQDLATTDDVAFNKVTVTDALIGGDLFVGSGGLDIRNGSGSVAATFASGNSQNLDIVGALTLGTELAIAEGGTGASTAAAARDNLGVEIGVDVQAYDATIVVDADIGVTVQAYDALLDSPPSNFGKATTSVVATTYTTLATDAVILANNASGVTITLLAATTAGDGFEMAQLEQSQSTATPLRQ
jgi:hypothetical protein